MKIRELLKEDQTLSIGKLTKEPGRFNNLVADIKSRQPLYLPDGTPVVIDPTEGDKLVQAQQAGTLKGRVGLKAEDGKLYPLTGFLKTKRYGGEAIPPGQEETTAPTKEGLKLKPSQIGLTNQNIPASKLGQAIANNQVLNSAPAGKVVIELTNAVTNHQPAVLPKGLDKNVVAAINDYAGEYIGVWALINNESEFANRDKFLEWLQMPIEQLTLYFPSKSNTSIADSYALVNPTSGHQINISSKGKGGGAPPSISGLKIPEHIRAKKQYATAVEFIDIIQNKSLPSPTTVSQPYAIMNMMAQRVPTAIPAEFRNFLPWNVNDITVAVTDSLKRGTPMPQYQNLWARFKFKGDSSDGGKLTHAVKVAVMEMVNSGAIPEFEAAVLEILDYNFIQQYTTIKRGIMTFQTQWPAKVNGRITVETKSGATDPTKGSFSFKLHFN